MKRYDCLKALASEVKDALVVSSAGAMTLEWNALQPSDGNFRVRTLGLCSSIALGMALGLPHRKVVALDGDGSLLMNLCSLPTIARMRPTNLVHIVFDNEVYEASGSKKTATGAGADLVGIARAAGIKNAQWAKTVDEFAQAAAAALRGDELVFHRRQSQHRANRGGAVIRSTRLKTSIASSVISRRSAKIEIFKTNLPASYDLIGAFFHSIMKIDIEFNSGAQLPMDAIPELARLAEAHGFDCAWGGEANNKDPTVMLSAIAAVTRQLKVGSAIYHILGRTPATLALQAMGLGRTDRRAIFTGHRFVQSDDR